MGYRFIKRVLTTVRKLITRGIETGEYASLALRHVLAVRVDLRLAVVRHGIGRSWILKSRTASDDDKNTEHDRNHNNASHNSLLKQSVVAANNTLAYGTSP